jgi:uncharacterized protein YqjF (DUF2071 family)
VSDFDYSIVEKTAHRPWPLRRTPWLMTQSWHDVLFAHWRVEVSELRRVVPPAFQLDLFRGEAWVGVVPFYMTNVGLRATPVLPWVSQFAELNVRTYVRVADRPGVYFFSLDAAHWIPVAAARAMVNLPYHVADMTVRRGRHGVQYESSRRHGRPAQFKATYEPVAESHVASEGSIEHFLTERYCLFNQNRRGQSYRLDIHHPPWSLHLARAAITENSMATANDLTLTGEPALLHYARRQDVVVWAPAFIRSPALERSTSAVACS